MGRPATATMALGIVLALCLMLVGALVGPSSAEAGERGPSPGDHGRDAHRLDRDRGRDHDRDGRDRDRRDRDGRGRDRDRDRGRDGREDGERRARHGGDRDGGPRGRPDHRQADDADFRTAAAPDEDRIRSRGQERGAGDRDDDRRRPGGREAPEREGPERGARDRGGQAERGARDDNRPTRPARDGRGSGAPDAGRGVDGREVRPNPEDEAADGPRPPRDGGFPDGRERREANPFVPRGDDASSPGRAAPDDMGTVAPDEGDGAAPSPSTSIVDTATPHLMGAGGFLQGDLGWADGSRASGPSPVGPTSPGPGGLGGLPLLLGLLGAFLAVQRGIGHGLGHVPMADVTERVPHEPS